MLLDCKLHCLSLPNNKLFKFTSFLISMTYGVVTQVKWVCVYCDRTHLEFSQASVVQASANSSQNSPVYPAGQAHLKLLMVVFNGTHVP